MATSATRPVPNNPLYPAPTQLPIQVASASGAITLLGGGIVHITCSTAAALTLAAPTHDGVFLYVLSTTAQAHTVTIAAGLGGAGAGADVGLFGGAVYDGCALYGYGGYWWPFPAADVNVTWG